MRLLVVGAGATGGYFGGRLAAAGRDVTFLVRAARVAHLQAHGIDIVSPNGNASVMPKLVTADSIPGAYDVVLLTVKAFGLEASLDDFAPAVGPETIIFPVLNGMRHLDVLTTRFGAKAVIGGVCKIAATIDKQGRIVQLAKFHELVYGEVNGAITDRIKELDAFMQGAGFDANLSPEIVREMWEKWLFLASLGAITCLMRGTIGEIAEAPNGADFARNLIGEIAAIVKACSHKPSEELLGHIVTSLTTEGSPLTSSMYRDLQQGNRIEADQIIGDLLASGRAKGVSTPLLAAVHANLCVYQGQLGR